ITADLIVAGAVGLAQPALDGDDVYWIEGRPVEAGRNVLVRRTPDGELSDVTPPPWNVRSRVHEYGGGAYAVRDGIAVFSNDVDARLHRLDVGDGSEPRPLTPPTDELSVRYADLVFDPARDRLVCVRESHDGDGEPVNCLVAVALEPAGDGDPGTVLAEGADFYSSPALSADGSRLAWLQWNHPNMPWDGTELWLAEVAADGSVTGARRVAGGPDVSVFQPRWLPDGSLVFVADQTGWWNLYRLRDPLDGGDPEPLWPMEAEFGAPQWVFGQSTYAVLGDGRLLSARLEGGTWRLSLLDPAGGDAPEPGPSGYPVVEDLQASGDRAVFIGSGPDTPATVVLADLGVHRLTPLRRSLDTVPDAGYLSMPRELEFPTTGDRTAFGFHYPPANRDARAPDGELPPLIVFSHGGPTGATDTSLNLGIQFWTSRGFAVLDVNYGGSTGHGRAYRERLNGGWGVVDVDDCAAGATFLADQGLVDPARLIIRGGSAGGYTTLAALCFRDVFAAGCSRYGVSDLEALATDTHKFESRYLDRLVAPYPAGRDVYVERSPIHHTDRLDCPIILFQGLEDRVVPPSQAERMFEAVRAKGLPVAYLAFEGEQHGFRRAENIKRTLEAELYFYGRIFGFAPADDVEPVEIANLPVRLAAP
ncbi:MAG TPA: S9 family peptidase, partial [Gemmatimonadota bacterium]|nr:S9 family peptidase [Gemmatimonadota bacterium]